MSPSTRICVLCGHDIGENGNEESLAWKNRFRIVYSNGNKIAVTGVGLIRIPGDAELSAPLDFGRSWSTSENVPIAIIRQRPDDGRYGFPLHSACWSILEEVCSPESVPQTRLYDLCRSLPFSRRVCCLTWNHDYGGLISIDDAAYPWEDQFNFHDLPFADSNPYLVPEIEHLLQEIPTQLGPPKVVSTSTDIFGQLPLEIITAIAGTLPINDFFNARLALRSFYSVFYVQKFWASKFRPNADRSWIFESRTWPTASDWLWLYRRTARLSSGMRNRERVWRLAEEMRALLLLGCAEPPPHDLSKNYQDQWVEAAADIRPERNHPYEGFDGGCRRFHEIQAQVDPNSLSHIAFSLIQPGKSTFITGMRLFLHGGEVIRLGYMTGNERIRSAESLTGIQLAVGSRGIQAARCLLKGGRELPWAGSPEDAPVTNRLSLTDPIPGFKAGFDGYKMVSLAVSNDNHVPHEVGLRNSSFWYPRVPDIGLDLHESGFTARDTACSRYEPVCYTMIGGPEGKYLKSLTGISLISEDGCPSLIEFHYDSEDVPLECRRVGRCSPSGYAKTTRLDIDGPGGEVIDTLIVHVGQCTTDVWYWKPGFLESIEIWTSFGNSLTSSTLVEHIEKSITIVKESTIQGFYWTQHEHCIVALGAITNAAHTGINDEAEFHQTG